MEGTKLEDGDKVRYSWPNGNSRTENNLKNFYFSSLRKITNQIINAWKMRHNMSENALST